MPLSNIDVDRILSVEEVRMLLAEDSAIEDEEFVEIKRRWTYCLKKCWRSKKYCDLRTDKVRVKIYKEEQTYIFATEDGKTIHRQSLCGKEYGYRCITEISYLTEMPRQSQLEGMSVADLEEISSKFLKNSPIKCLVDAGFTLKLIVPRDFLGL